MGRLKKLLAAIAILLVVVLGGAVAAVNLRWKRTFDAPYPEIHASTDPATIARGKYLVYGPAGCAYCHVPRDRWPDLDRGELLPLTGNHLFRLPPGDIYSQNITPDPQTGIGGRTDAELARVLRYGVRADGRAAFPLMAFHNVADDDLTALTSFLRSQPPVRLAVPDHQLGLLGKALMAFAIGPMGPDGTPPASAPTGLSVERGQYLANSVASCVECHTDRDPRNGSFVGPKFGGGQRMDLADQAKIAVPPNLTPDPKTSPIGVWSEDDFVTRFRAGATLPGTPMPWGAYARMTDDDLRSVFRYLKTLPPFEHATGPGMQDR